MRMTHYHLKMSGHLHSLPFLPFQFPFWQHSVYHMTDVYPCNMSVWSSSSLHCLNDDSAIISAFTNCTFSNSPTWISLSWTVVWLHPEFTKDWCYSIVPPVQSGKTWGIKSQKGWGSLLPPETWSSSSWIASSNDAQWWHWTHSAVPLGAKWQTALEPHGW